MRNDKIQTIKVRKGTYSLQGCSHWQETIITKNKIYFKQKASTDEKPIEKYKKEILNGRSIIPIA